MSIWGFRQLIEQIDANWQKDRMKTEAYEFSNGRKFNELPYSHGLYGTSTSTST